MFHLGSLRNFTYGPSSIEYQANNFFSYISAPGDYVPEKSAAALLDNAPKYTFGMRTQVYKPSDTPGKLKF